MADAFDLAVVVARFRGLTLAARTRELQRMIGAASDDAGVLHRRALLITALREAELWPYRSDVAAT